MTCYNLSRNPFRDLNKSLIEIIPTQQLRKVYIKGTNDELDLVGMTDESQPQAIIQTNSGVEVVPCENLLLGNGTNGSIETGISAFAKDLNKVVKVIAVGSKYAKVDDESSPQEDVLIETLIPIKTE